jgi:thiamine biosynthesis protein ThiI
MSTPRVIIHYDEIALKRGKRRQFEDRLVQQLNMLLQVKKWPLKARNAWGRIFIDAMEDAPLPAENEEQLRAHLRLFPGVANFFFITTCEKSMQALEALAPFFTERLIGKPFRVTARRTDKNFPLKSWEIERAFAAALFRAAPDGALKASMKDYELEVHVEVLDQNIVVYLKEPGIGGLAIGSSGNAVSLLSAGFDSPVATFMLMKRGVRMWPLHFHSVPLVSDESLEAARDLAQRLSFIQGKLTLALCPVLPIQKHLEERAPEHLRIVLLRRSFMRLASAYAKQARALALATGESVGQVASQTMENMFVIDRASDYPVLRPVCGLNKREIIDLARKIDTEEISARPCDDTCSLFLPQAPETKAQLDKVLAAEMRLDLARLDQEALENIDRETYRFGEELEK